MGVELRNLKPGKHVATVVVREGKLASRQEVTFAIENGPRAPQSKGSARGKYRSPHWSPSPRAPLRSARDLNGPAIEVHMRLR